MSSHHVQRVESSDAAAAYTLIDLPLYAVSQLCAACDDAR